MSSPFYWARVKPYNPKRQHTIQRIHCLGRLWRGGDGVNKIPDWVKVTPELAQKLLVFKQSDRDPWAERVFDIVTPEKRARIDTIEEEARRAIRSQGKALSEMPNVAAQEVDLVQDTPDLEDILNEEPSTISALNDATARQRFKQEAKPTLSVEDFDTRIDEPEVAEMLKSANKRRQQVQKADDSLEEQAPARQKARQAALDDVLAEDVTDVSQVPDDVSYDPDALDANDDDLDIEPGEVRYVNGKAVPVTEDNVTPSFDAAALVDTDDEGVLDVPTTRKSSKGTGRRAKR